MTGYLLDTHIWLWIMREAREKVSAGFFAEVEVWQRRGLAYLSPISCWEIGLLLQAKRIVLHKDTAYLWERDTNSDGFRIAELTGGIFAESTRLPGVMHGDPSDRILAATARVSGLTLVTRDSKLLDYAKAGHVRARTP